MGIGAGIAASVAGGLASSVAADALQDDPPSPSGSRISQPSNVDVNMPFGSLQRRQQGGRLTFDFSGGDEFAGQIDQREQIINDIWDSIGVTDQQRMQQFQNARDAFIGQFDERFEPVFQQQNESMFANQLGRGRAGSSVARRERNDLRERQMRQQRQNFRQAEQLARDLQANEDARRFNLLNTAFGQRQQLMNQPLQLAGIANQGASQNLAQNRSMFNQQMQSTQLGNQQTMGNVGTGLAIGGNIYSQFANQNPPAANAVGSPTLDPSRFGAGGGW